MKKIILFTLAIFSVSYTAVGATTIIMNFTAFGFYEIPPLSGIIAPDDPVSGTITWEAATVNSPIISLTSIDLTIDGFSYSLGDIAFDNTFPVIGGILNGPDYVYSNAGDDFAIVWDPLNLTPFVAVYATSNYNEIFETDQFTEFNIEAAPVPEPVSMLIFGTGIIGVFGAARRRSRNM